jgi:hypothetical protein
MGPGALYTIRQTTCVWRDTLRMPQSWFHQLVYPLVVEEIKVEETFIFDQRYCQSRTH